MTRPALSELHNIRRSMQKRLAFYMITLGIILAATLVAGLFFFNQLKSPREELVTSLNFRMEAFASDMESLWRNVSVMGVHLSEDMTDLIEEQTSDFSSLSGDVAAVSVWPTSGLLRRVRDAEHFSERQRVLQRSVYPAEQLRPHGQ